MSTEQLRNAVAGTTQQKPAGLPQLLEKMKPQLALALPKHMNPDRMLRIALTQLRVTPKLAECEQQSVVACVVMAAQLGLEPGINGQAYLIPYWDNKKRVFVCTFVPGWKGLVDLAQRSGRASVWTGAVRQGDRFDYERGTKPYLTHKEGDNNFDSLVTHVYAIGWVKGAEYPVVEVWPMGKVFAHRDKFNKVGERHYSFAHPEMYGRKVALLQVLKYMPQSIELSTALDLDADAELGRQRLDTSIIEGTAASGYVSEASQEESDQPAGAESGTASSAAAAAGGKPHPITVADAISLLKVCKTKEAIEATMVQIGNSYGDAEIPSAIVEEKNARLDALRPAVSK